MKRLSIILCLGVFLMITVPTSAQKETDFIYGEVLDLKTGQPVVFATIRVKGKALGVISNSDGGFRLPLHFATEGEGLVISCLGYKTLEIPLKEMATDSTNLIRLETEPIELEESVIEGKRKRPPGARGIVKRAIDKIPLNYPQAAFSYVGYYRDYQKRDGKYINLNEALLRVLDQGFSTADSDSTEIQLYRYQENTDFVRDKLSARPYNYLTGEKTIRNAHLYNFGGNELSILRIHDAIRNYKEKTYSFVDVMERDLLKNHSLERIADAFINGERMFVISLLKNKPAISVDEFSEQPATSRFIAAGKIYISQTTYAIHKLVYKVLDTRRGADQKGVRTQPGLVFEVEVEYKDYRGKMYPNYISFQNVFTLKKSSFYLKAVTLNKTNQSLGVRFNLPTTRLVDRTEKNFDLRLNGKKIRIRAVDYLDMGYQLYFHPEDFTKLSEVLEGLNRIDQVFVPGVFELYFANIIDDQGNDINAYKLENYLQFREFFVQQIIENPAEELPEGILINMNAPLNTNRVAVKATELDQYWMNTPMIKDE